MPSAAQPPGGRHHRFEYHRNGLPPCRQRPHARAGLINGEPFAVHADHLNTPRRLTDAQGRPRWQWAFSGFGEQTAQSIPRTNLPTIQYSLRYPGQVDDGNGLFYNFNRFYDPLAGRYTQADPIGLAGGWNRFGYVGGNAVSGVDPMGLACSSSGGATNCQYPGGPSFTVPSTPEFPAYLGPNNWFYHNYDVSEPLGTADRECVLKELQRGATPGNSNGSSPSGTWNDAKVGPFYNPVKSYTTTDLATGSQLVVNMTTKGGVFADGYVARGILGSNVHTWGEGDSPWQSPYLTGFDTQFVANQWVWGNQMREIVEKCSCRK